MTFITEKWQTMTIIVIGILILVSLAQKILAGGSIDSIVTIDLGLGIFSLVLAMYVYNKEKKLEERMNRETKDKAKKAYADIHTSLVIFERTLDNLLINGHKENDTSILIENSVNIRLLHSNLRMVFSAHIDIIDKNIMSRLAQHISILERYSKDKKVELLQHMDVMHDMDRLLVVLSDQIGDDYHLKGKRPGDELVRKQRNNHFMIYFLERIYLAVTHSDPKLSEEEIHEEIISYHNDMVYYIDPDAEIFKMTVPTLYNIDPLLSNSKDPDSSNQYASKIKSLIGMVHSYDNKIIQNDAGLVEQLADYSAIMSPMEFLIRTLGVLDSASTWNHSAHLRIRSILNIIKRECKHIPPENKEYIVASLNELVGLDTTKDQYVKKLADLKEYLVQKITAIQQKEHK